MDVVYIIFFASLFLLLHTYIFYPVSIQVLSLIFRKKYNYRENYQPSVSILISTFNEEKVIKETLTKLCEQKYYKGKIEILVGSDGSMDSTNDIVQNLTHTYSSINFYAFADRRGKKFVLNDLVERAKSEILVFCDSNTYYSSNAISELIKYYADSRVGGVSGRLILAEKRDNLVPGNKEAVYWRYESWIKYCEGSLGYLIGANGGIYSIRKKYFTPMPMDTSVVDDLYLSLKILEQGKDMLYCKQALAYETIAPSINLEIERKARIIPRSFETIKQVKRLLFSKRLLISYNLWSHKMIRWFTPIILTFLFLSNLMISANHSSVAYNIVFVMQLFFVFLGILGYICTRLNVNFRFLQLIYFFFVSNYALIKGLYRFLINKYSPTWNSTPR